MLSGCVSNWGDDGRDRVVVIIWGMDLSSCRATRRCFELRTGPRSLCGRLAILKVGFFRTKKVSTDTLRISKNWCRSFKGSGFHFWFIPVRRLIPATCQALVCRCGSCLAASCLDQIPKPKLREFGGRAWEKTRWSELIFQQIGMEKWWIFTDFDSGLTPGREKAGNKILGPTFHDKYKYY